MQLYFKEYGQGRPIIFLHGLFGASDNWHQIAIKLAETCHVYALDQRNHGQAPHSAEMNFSLMANDVEEFMTSQGLETALVVGHSMGGKTAMQFALQFPERVERLVVSDMAPRQYAPAHDKIFAALLALDLAAYQSRTPMEEVLAGEIPNLVLRRFLLKNLGRDAEGKFFWKFNLRGLAENYPQLCAPIECSPPFTKPALFVRGGKSDYIKPEDEVLIREQFPQAEIKTIAESGHWVHADAPAAFLNLLSEFIGKNP